MIFNLIKLKKVLVILIILVSTTSCSTFYTIENISDFKQLTLQVGDEVKVYTIDKEVQEFMIYRVEEDYIYGQNDNPSIKKDEIIKLELSRTDTGRATLGIFGIFVFALMFSG